MTTISIELRVYGMPGPQGSKKFVGRGSSGRGIMVESSQKVKPWREAIKQVIMAEGHPKITGPITAEMIFTLPKPRSAPKRRRTFPDRKPDLSKLVRSTEDALTDMAVWEDDARVIQYTRLAKVYPGEDPDALTSPGVVIRLRPVDEETL